MSDINLVITTYNRPRELVQCVGAALQSDVGLSITVVDNSPQHYAEEMLYRGRFADYKSIRIVTLPRAIGWGPSINLAYALYDDYTICCNDDVAVHPHTIRCITQAADDYRAGALFYGAHDGDSMWSLFLLRKQAFLEMGPLDPAFYPLHYEDIDAIRRLHLLGYEPTTVYTATYDHVKNGTIKAFSADEKELFDRQFDRNERYFHDKWGGYKFQERHTAPFNGERPRVPTLIKE